MSQAIIAENCRQLAEDRAKLRRKFEERQKTVRLATILLDKDIRELQGACAATRAVLVTNLETCRDLFKKPKTVEFSGIVVGFAKEQDAITMPENDILVDRIEKLLPAKQAETVLDRSVSIIKTAFKKLPRELLQRLGCNIVSGADKPVVRPNDDDIEDLVQKSLGEAEGQS